MQHISQGKSSLGIDANIAALLSYLLVFASGMLFYVLERENKFVRFHATQSMITFTVFFVLGVNLRIMPLFGSSPLMLLGIIEVGVWIILMIKAYKGEYFKLPLIGNFAEKQSSRQ